MLDKDATINIEDSHNQNITLTAVKVTVAEGADKGKSQTLRTRSSIIGSGETCQFKLEDPTVSRNHLEITLEDDGFCIQDLGSKNGIYAGAVQIHRSRCTTSTKIRVGATTLAIEPTNRTVKIPVSNEIRFGEVLGKSETMRLLFKQLSEVAQHDTPILLEGETGTGKELLAKAIHNHSSRSDKPFVILDCSVLPPTLAERELFGHVRGAFTDAKESVSGIFERANGGTLFIDEIGELPLELQPLLLRVLENGEYKPVGSTETRTFEARCIYATNRNLRKEVNDGNFRTDLFYRISVAHVQIPPLRERMDDIMLLATHFIQELSETYANKLSDHDAELLLAKHVQKLTSYPWPGNVRELRNRIERLYIKLSDSGMTNDSISLSIPNDQELQVTHLCKKQIMQGYSFRDAKKQAVELFEYYLIKELLEQCDGNISEASRRCQMDRRNFQKLVRKYGL